jgi:cell division protein FtsW
MAQRARTDWTLFGTIVLMVCFGLVMVYSSSSAMAELNQKLREKEQYPSVHFVVRQLGWAVVSFFVLMSAKRLDYRRLNNPRVAFGALGIVILLLVAVFFADWKAHRWFHLGVASFQPSEFAKPALIIFLAYFLSMRGPEAINNKHVLRQVMLVLFFVAFAVVVADLGTALVLIATAAVIFFAAGLRPKYCVIALACGLVFAGIAVVSKPYRIARVVAFVDPDGKRLDQLNPDGRIKGWLNKAMANRDPYYQVKQSKIAVGSGGPLGLGPMQSRQKWLFLPEAHTDFIYAVVAEELGLFGTCGVLGGFLIIMVRGVRLYWTAPDEFGRYLALGVTACIVVQALFNMSVVLGIGPTKGIPLPMISYGGTSLLTSLICLGILLSVSERSA